MGDDSCCDICKRKTAPDDKILLDHLERVLDPKKYVGDTKKPVIFENDKQIVIKCRDSPGIKNVVPLRPYEINTELLDQNEEIQKLSRNPTEINYANRFHILLWIEEHFAQKELERHNQRGIKLITGDTKGKPSLYGINVLGLSDGRPSLIKNDRVRIHKENLVIVDEETNSKKYCAYEGLIQEIIKDEIYVAPDATRFEYQHDEEVGIEILLNRRPYQLSHRALDQIDENLLDRTLFPKKIQAKKQKTEPMKLKFVNKKISNDEKQQQAIESIIRRTSGSAPYILIGPPGTGKTATIVEAIHQLWNRSKSKKKLPKICICAASNQAIDVIVKRLLGRDGLEDDRLTPPPELQENVIRVYAKTRERDEYLMDCSTNEVNVDELQAKRIIATTTLTAGWLIDKGFGKSWFDYLFIDEAGQATETNILVPIAGFFHDKCYLVLAGDPKQLGPVVVSPFAKEKGLGVSLMERLFRTKQKLTNRKKSNQTTSLCTTTLNNNYRSHPKIIHLPNKFFYHGQLKAKGEAKRIFLVSDSEWKELSKRNPGYPIIFRGIEGTQRVDGNSPSCFNVEEIVAVKYYIDELLGRKLCGDKPIVQENIGIISPYRNQVEKIKKYLNHMGLNGIRVGSVESFQGSEKPIIIISTVKSKGLGFLKEPRRFNVAITRAIALLIVIGHPKVLYKESRDLQPNYWRELINECYRHHSCKGVLPAELKKN